MKALSTAVQSGSLRSFYPLRKRPRFSSEASGSYRTKKPACRRAASNGVKRERIGSYAAFFRTFLAALDCSEVAREIGWGGRDVANRDFDFAHSGGFGCEGRGWIAQVDSDIF